VGSTYFLLLLHYPWKRIKKFLVNFFFTHFFFVSKIAKNLALILEFFPDEIWPGKVIRICLIVKDKSIFSVTMVKITITPIKKR